MGNIDQSTFRSVLSHVPTSVVVVTGFAPDGAPVGVTIGSFTSISLDPPLVGFFASTHMKAWETMRSHGKFCVNVLSADQQDLCWTFASSNDDRFTGVEYELTPAGLPLLKNVAAWIDCAIESESVHGDHLLVVGRVHDLSVNAGADSAMIFYKGSTGSAAAGND